MMSRWISLVPPTMVPARLALLEETLGIEA